MTFALGVLTGVAATTLTVTIFMVTWGRAATLNDRSAQAELNMRAFQDDNGA